VKNLETSGYELRIAECMYEFCGHEIINPGSILYNSGLERRVKNYDFFPGDDINEH